MTSCRGILRALMIVAMLPPATAHTQSALHFTLPYGRFAVGFKSVDQYDSSRSFGDNADADGRPRTGEHARPIQTSIWYPAGSNAGRPMTYGDYLGLIAAPGTLPSHDSATRASAARALAHRFSPDSAARSAREMSAPTHAIQDAAPFGDRFPVIVYSASLAAPSFENAKLMEYLASFGYIVVASPSYGPAGPQTSDAPGLEAQARDMEFLIEYARRIPGADTSRLAVMGFSWGGLASVLATMRNPSVKALVSLDGSIAYFYHRLFERNPDMNIARFTVPSLFLKQHPPSAEMKKSLGPDSVFDFFKDIKYSDATLVTFNTLSHQNFGEWFDRLQYAPGPAFVADTLVQSAGYEHSALYVRHFLDATLKRDQEGQAFLARSPAENGIPAAELTVEHHPGLKPPEKRFEQE